MNLFKIVCSGDNLRIELKNDRIVISGKDVTLNYAEAKDVSIKPKPMAIEPDYFEHFYIPFDGPEEWNNKFSDAAKENYLQESVLLGIKDEIMKWRNNALKGIPFNGDERSFPLPEEMSENWANHYIAHIYCIESNDVRILERLRNE